MMSLSKYLEEAAFSKHLEEIEILKAASSKYLFNDIITGWKHPMYRLIPSVSDLNSQRLTAQAGQIKKFWQPTTPANDVTMVKKKGLREPTEWDDGEVWK